MKLSCLRKLEIGQNTIMCLACSPDAQLVAGGTYNSGLVFIWELSTGKLLKTLKGHQAPVRSVIISPDSQKLVSCSDDTRIKIWNIDTGECIRTLIRQVSYTNLEKELADDEYEPELLSEGHSSTVWSVAFSQNGKVFISGSVE